MATDTPHDPHDKLFKWTFEVIENAIPELRAVLPPELLAQMDLSTLHVESREFVDAALRASYADLLYTVQLGSKQALIHLLFEHQSSSPKFTLLALLGHQTDVLKTHAHQHPNAYLPIVIPVVLFHSESGWTAGRRMQELFDPELVADPALSPFVPPLNYVLDDISQLSDEALQARALTLTASLSLWAMRDSRARERLLQTFPNWLPTMDELLGQPNGRQAFDTIFYYITEVSKLTTEDFSQVARLATPEVEKAIMTLAEQLRVEGRAEGEAKLLLRQLALKFGALSEPTRTRVTQASEDDLTRWAERILTATSLEQVFEDPQ